MGLTKPSCSYQVQEENLLDAGLYSIDTEGICQYFISKISMMDGLETHEIDATKRVALILPLRFFFTHQREREKRGLLNQKKPDA